MPEQSATATNVVSDAVMTLIDLDSAYKTRLEAMRKLGYDVSPRM
ncbi:hypothetical protein [Pontiella sulfatireligans]|nr:hypothetical protein [Pontiella sulfatireligans]